MKRLAIYLLIAVAAMVTLSSCSHNNGDIGYWFGLWHLDTVEIDGTPVADYDGNTYFLFQGKVFCVRCINEEDHSYSESFAKWQESDDHKTVTITFADEHFPPMINNHMCLETVTTFKVITLTDKEMTLEHIHSETGVAYTFHLSLWQ